jgi:Tfp pilus assembly protein PilF
MAKSAVNNHETAKRYVNQGYTYLNQGQLETATKKATDALNIDPPYQNAKKLLEKIKQKYFDRGTNYVDKEEYDKAIPPLKKAIAIDSQFKEAYCNLGRAYLKLGEFEKAITAARNALAIDSNYECAKNIIDSIDIGEN